MDATDITNAEFEKFVKATGYVTIAERAPTKEEFPTAPPENLVAGSVVFTPTSEPVPLDDHFLMLELRQGRKLAAPRRSAKRHQGQRKLSSRPNRLPRRGSLREMGG
jgi:formylglycine-generating enzyme required for sulfatase activity